MVSALLSLAHLLGLVLGVGAATVKLAMLLRARANRGFVPMYLEVAGPMTRLIQVGIVLLTLSGIGWLVLGYPLTSRLAVKLVLVAAIWVMGPVIDNMIEPRFRRASLAPEPAAAPAFARLAGLYLGFELAATGLFYAVIVYWVLVNRLSG